MKNIVFIPNIDLGNNRSTPYHYSVNSWKHFCDKHNCELIVWEDLLYPVDYMKITWQRYYVFDILEANDIDYNQILMVDADTIVHPDCPNFFEETDNKYCGVVNNGCYEWVTRSISGFGDELFGGKRIIQWNYINGGFQIINKNHKDFYKKVVQYYNDNSKKIIDTIAKLETATDQTIINYLLHENNIDVKYLPDCYNLVDLYRKNLIFVDKAFWFEDKLHFLNAGWVYHFNAIPPNNLKRDVAYWMERTYKELYSV